MPTLFLDSSAILKRYIDETGSAWLRSMVQSNIQRCYVARIAGVEVVSAIVRLASGKHITPDTRVSALRQFKRDFISGYIAADVSEAVIVLAMRLAERHVLRGYDAVQLAMGVTVIAQVRATGGDGIFVCADDTLNRAAKVEGLIIENPNDHP